MLITSKTIISQEELAKNNGFTYSKKIDKKGITKEITEPLLSNETSSKLRAIQEILDFGYENEIVEFETYFVDLKINDVIKISAPTFRIPRELNKDKFIVKKITHYFKLGEFRSKVKAIRYETL